MQNIQTQHVGIFRAAKYCLYKRLTLLLFFILPQKLTNVFVSLSIVSLIYSLRDMQLHNDENIKEKLSELLCVNINDGILLLPENTFQWYWNDHVLDSKMETTDGFHTVREVIISSDLFFKNRHSVVGRLIDALPKSISIKMKLSEAVNRLSLKHSVTSVLIYI